MTIYRESKVYRGKSYCPVCGKTLDRTDGINPPCCSEECEREFAGNYDVTLPNDEGEEDDDAQL